MLGELTGKVGLSGLLSVLNLTANPTTPPTVSASFNGGTDTNSLRNDALSGPAVSGPSMTTPYTPVDIYFTGNSIAAPVGDRVYGGQVLAQALLACGRTVDTDRPPHSLHAYFLREGSVKQPIDFEVEVLHDGNSFSARRVSAIQSGRPILTASASFQRFQPGYDAQIPMPAGVPGPDAGTNTRDHLSDSEFPNARWWGRDSAFDFVQVSPPIYLQSDPHPTSQQLVWVRAKGIIPPPTSSYVSEQLWHRALLAFACDQLLLEPTVRGAGLSWVDLMQRRVAMASLDHAMWWHRDVRVDQWLLFVQEAGSSYGGRAMGQARVYTQDGALVATIAQEGMMRLPAR